MKDYDMLEVIGRIDSSFIMEAADSVHISRRWEIKKWLPALAACAAIILMIPLAKQLLTPKGGPAGPDSGYWNDDGLKEVRALEINGCYYEATDISEVLRRYGLPEMLTETDAGEHVSYLISDGSAGYIQAASQTDIEMFTYSKDPCRGVYIIKDEGKYCAALFCNLILQPDSSAGFSELYRMYGIENAGDILSVTETDWHRNDPVRESVTDRSALSEFYRLTMELFPNSNQEFQSEVFDNVPEDQQQKKHTEFADDCRMIRIETGSGLRFYIELYPSFGWVYGNGAMSYFRMTSSMTDWIKDNLS